MQRSNTPATGLSLSDISIRFDDVIAVRDASISVASGEFFTLLGPSGCGKTTLLRAIAGFLRQSAGTIRLGDAVLDDVPAYRRDVGMVFQNYAVFPHLNVHDNVAYGLKSRKISGAELDSRVSAALEMVDLLGYEKRMPKQLSGGQQQRVVIARAVAIRPRVLLMDEPLANLDAKLRVKLRADLKDLQRRLNITTIYVTHDQEEALSLSDRIAVMGAGRVLHIGTPQEIYNRPTSMQVAQFIGEGTFLPGIAKEGGAGAVITLADGRQLVVSGFGSDLRGPVHIGFRPQDVMIQPGDGGGGHAADDQGDGLAGTVRSKSFFGPYVNFDIDCGLPSPVMAQINARQPAAELAEGAAVRLRIPSELTMVFAGGDEKAAQP